MSPPKRTRASRTERIAIDMMVRQLGDEQAIAVIERAILDDPPVRAIDRDTLDRVLAELRKKAGAHA